MDDQTEVIAFLSDSASYGLPGQPVERIETHISIVFLIGERVFKLKRAVHFSYLDYSTTALREEFCKREHALNRRTAPDLYLGVHAIRRNARGALAFGDAGTAVDWVLEMRRFAQSDLFDQLAEAEKLTPDLMRELTDVIASFHQNAERTPGHGGSAAIEETIRGSSANLLASCPPLARDQIEQLDARSMASLSQVATRLDARRKQGKIRRCHGDLHLRNICLFEGQPTLFDCIDFSDAHACIDVLYDLSFLLMDLVHRGLRDFANLVFNRYIDVTSDDDGLLALPLFMSMRAAIRAHVLVAQNPRQRSRKTTEVARSYLALAGDLLHVESPSLIAVGGLSGVGKSTLARALAPDLPPAPGARIIRSDVLRKRLFGVTPETKLPPTAYDQSTTERVYEMMQSEAVAALSDGFTAIADATFLRPEERKRMAGVAERAGVPFVPIWLEAPHEMLTARIDARVHDASDATAQVLRRQLSYDFGTIDWPHIDASGDMTATVADARALIRRP